VAVNVANFRRLDIGGHVVASEWCMATR
jgi:hypothetical protein